MAAAEIDPQDIMAKFEELALLESEFDDAELEIIRKAEAIQAPLYKKRAEFVAGIPHFWCLVLEQAPPEIDNFIQPTDSEVLAECLDTFEVSRFELNDPKGSPRSFSLKFGFKDNEWFENKTIEKKFWFRKSKDWEGLVSEPVKINWKNGKDLTSGLTDAAYKLYQARQTLKDPKKESQLPEHKALETMIETTHEASVSFFGLFAFVSGYRWVSAEESAQADKEEKERLEKVRRGEQIPEDDEDDEIEDIEDFQAVEVFPGGDEVATILAEDLWQNAIKYYKSHFEEDGMDSDDEDLSEVDVDMEEEDDDESAEEVDIRALVGKGKKDNAQPPNKRQRKA